MTSLYHLIGAAHSLYAHEFHAKDDTDISEVRGCTSIYQLLARGIKPHLASEHAWSGMNFPRFCEGDPCRRKNAARKIRRICETPTLRVPCPFSHHCCRRRLARCTQKAASIQEIHRGLQSMLRSPPAQEAHSGLCQISGSTPDKET